MPSQSVTQRNKSRSASEWDGTGVCIRIWTRPPFIRQPFCIPYPILNNVSDDYVIQAEGLVQVYDKKTVVDHVSLNVRRGEIFGFLGPNGAGKTTTIRMLTTIDRPKEGRVSINGSDTSQDILGARRSLGIIQQHNSLDKDLTVRQNIVHHGLMQNLSMDEIRRRMGALVETMELEEMLDREVDKLSGGWKRRVSIVCALIHEPAVLFMDEPTTGLDTQSRNLLWKTIRSINRKGTTIFLTTHYIFEAEALCDRVAIINKGKVIEEGAPKELTEKLGPVALCVTDPDGNEDVTFHQSIQAAKEASMDSPDDCAISIRSTNLEDVFLELTGRRFRCTTSSARRPGWRTAICATSRRTSRTSWCLPSSGLCCT
ncbi:MAG: ABC transporter ATP-binding protein [Candidatus Methanomethylophilaceae archaeon]|nr:ABC transporter ATP-binding protein [Candidatus Methanomethylophilaceae archaeon]